MGAIGDYIHYTSKGYLEHGTTQTGAFHGWVSQRPMILEKLKQNKASSLNAEEQKELEDLLTSFLKNEEGNPNITKIQKEIQEKMNELFGDALQSIDFETGNVQAKRDTSSSIGIAKNATNIEDIISRINKLESIIIENAEKLEIPKGMSTQVRQLKSYYNKLAKELKVVKQANGQDAATALLAERTKDLREKKRLLNELISEYAPYPAVALQKGTFFEHLIAQAPRVAQNEAMNAIGEVIGDVTESVAFNKEAFASQFLTQQVDEILSKTSVSQGKIDVSLTWKEKNLGISAKNYNLDRYYVHVLSGSSLLYMLQDLDSDFVNHFLNLYAAHGKMEGQKNVGIDNSRLAAMKSGILQEIKLILLYKGLTGDTSGRSSANLFIINDSSKGKVKVLDMYEIINRVGAQKIKGIKLNDKTLDEKIKFRNDWDIGSPQQRISKLLLDVHARKVSVAIGTEFLK